MSFFSLISVKADLWLSSLDWIWITTLNHYYSTLKTLVEEFFKIRHHFETHQNQTLDALYKNRHNSKQAEEKKCFMVFSSQKDVFQYIIKMYQAPCCFRIRLMSLTLVRSNLVMYVRFPFVKKLGISKFQYQMFVLPTFKFVALSLKIWKYFTMS